MPTKARHPTLTEHSNRTGLAPSKTRAVGEQLIPLTDYWGINQRGARWYNRASYDGHKQDNQLRLYDNFKMSVLKDYEPSRLQDIVAQNGTVAAAMDAYVSVVSTDMKISPGAEDGVDLWRVLTENAKFKRSRDQIFEMLFLRGGAVVEMLFDNSMGMGVFVPVELRVHDPRRFDFEEQGDLSTRNGDKWVLGLTSMDIFGEQFARLQNPAVEYIAWRPKAGEKPFGRSRVSASTYYTAVLVNTIQLVTKILAKSGSPVLPITIDKEKLFGGEGNMEQLFPGDDLEGYVAQQAKELRKIVPQLGEGDALILTGECVIGEYLTPASKINMEFLNEWSNQLRLDILQSMNVPPAVVGIVQKSASLNDHNTKVLIRDFKNSGHNDQKLVADHLQPIFSYAGRVNNLRLPSPVHISFMFSNPEEVDLMLDVKQKRATTMKDTTEWITAAKQEGVIDEARAAELFEMEYMQLDLTKM